MNLYINIGIGRILLIITSLTMLLSWLLPNHYEPWITSHSDFCAFIAWQSKT